MCNQDTTCGHGVFVRETYRVYVARLHAIRPEHLEIIRSIVVSHDAGFHVCPKSTHKRFLVFYCLNSTCKILTLSLFNDEGEVCFDETGFTVLFCGESLSPPTTVTLDAPFQVPTISSGLACAMEHPSTKQLEIKNLFVRNIQ